MADISAICGYAEQTQLVIVLVRALEAKSQTLPLSIGLSFKGVDCVHGQEAETGLPQGPVGSLDELLERLEGHDWERAEAEAAWHLHHEACQRSAAIAMGALEQQVLR